MQMKNVNEIIGFHHMCVQEEKQLNLRYLI